MEETISESIKALFFNNSKVKQAYENYIDALKKGEITSYRAAKELLELYSSADRL